MSNRNTQHGRPKAVRFYERDTLDLRDGEVIERNGSLTYVEDRETGARDWYAGFEIEGGGR